MDTTIGEGIFGAAIVIALALLIGQCAHYNHIEALKCMDQHGRLYANGHCLADKNALP